MNHAMINLIMPLIARFIRMPIYAIIISLPRIVRKPVSFANVKIHQLKFTGARRMQASGVVKPTG